MVSAAKARFVLQPYLVSLVLSCSIALEKEAHSPRLLYLEVTVDGSSSPPVDIGSHREQEELGQQMHTNFPDDYISLGTLIVCSANSYWILIRLSQPSHLCLHSLAYAALRLGS